MTGLVGMLGPASVGIMLLVLGNLSRRLGAVTHAHRYYIGFYVAALLVGLSVLVRLVYLINHNLLADPAAWGGIYNSLFASGVTIGLIFAWRYWSWLLAERN
jgi:hypothetical protein